MSTIKRAKGRPKKSQTEPAPVVTEPAPEPQPEPQAPADPQTPVRAGARTPRAPKKRAVLSETVQSMDSNPRQTDAQVIDSILEPGNLPVVEHFTLDTELTINGKQTTFNDAILSDCNNTTRALVTHIRKLERHLIDQNKKNVKLVLDNKILADDIRKKNYMLRELTFNYLIDDHFEEYKAKGTLVKNLQTTLSPITKELLDDLNNCYRASKVKHPNIDMIAYFLSNLRQFYIHLKSEDCYYYIHENDIIRDHQGGYLFKIICDTTGEIPSESDIEHEPTDDSDSDTDFSDLDEPNRPKSQKLAETDKKLMEAERRILERERLKKLQEEALIKGITVEELQKQKASEAAAKKTGSVQK